MRVFPALAIILLHLHQAPAQPATQLRAAAFHQRSFQEILSQISVAAGHGWDVMERPGNEIVIRSTSAVAMNVRVDVSDDTPGPKSAYIRRIKRTLERPMEVRFQNCTLTPPLKMAELILTRSKNNAERSAFETRHLSQIRKSGKLANVRPSPPAVFRPKTPRERDLLTEYELLWKRTESRVPVGSHFCDQFGFLCKPLDPQPQDKSDQSELNAMVFRVERILRPYSIIAGTLELRNRMQQELPDGWSVTANVAAGRIKLSVQSDRPLMLSRYSPNIGPRREKETVRVSMDASSYMSSEMIEVLSRWNEAQRTRIRDFEAKHLTDVAAGQLTKGGRVPYDQDRRPRAIPPENYWPESEKQEQLVAEYRLLWNRTQSTPLPGYYSGNLHHPISIFRTDEQQGRFDDATESGDTNAAVLKADIMTDRWWRIDDRRKSADYKQILKLIDSQVRPY